MSYNPVRPGDLISAAYFNQVFQSFDQRLSVLEASQGVGGGRMVITGISPAGPLHMGDQITVLGQNFGLPSQIVVTINDARVDSSSFLAGSGNTALIFAIPVVQGVGPNGQLVTLTVSNPTTAASTQFTLFPFSLTIPTGQLFVNMTGPPNVGSITANNSYVFLFTVTGDTSMAENFVLTATLDNASKAAGWIAVPVNPQSSATITQIQIPGGQNTATQIGVKVTIPTVAGVANAQLTFGLVSILNPTGLTGSGSTTITVGVAPPPPNSIAINIVAVSASGIAGATFSGNTSITLPRGTTTGVLAVNALCPVADNYTCSPPTFDDAGWTASVTASKQTFTTTQANQTVLIQINLSTVPPGPSQSRIHFQIKANTQLNVVGQIAPTIGVS